MPGELPCEVPPHVSPTGCREMSSNMSRHRHACRLMCRLTCRPLCLGTAPRYASSLHRLTCPTSPLACCTRTAPHSPGRVGGCVGSAAVWSCGRVARTQGEGKGWHGTQLHTGSHGHRSTQPPPALPLARRLYPKCATAGCIPIQTLCEIPSVLHIQDTAGCMSSILSALISPCALAPSLRASSRRCSCAPPAAASHARLQPPLLAAMPLGRAWPLLAPCTSSRRHGAWPYILTVTLYILTVTLYILTVTLYILTVTLYILTVTLYILTVTLYIFTATHYIFDRYALYL
jgi:hypothetical protein